MNELYFIIETLKSHVKNYGEVPLTNLELLKILKIAIDVSSNQDEIINDDRPGE